MTPQTQFEARALPMIARGVPIAPVLARSKKARLRDWPELASIDPNKIEEWAAQGPDDNTACVALAKPGGVFFLEIDAPNFHEVIEQQSGKKLPATFAVSSRPGEGRGHFYYRFTPETIALARKINKAFISGKDENGKEAWSLRLDSAYVVGPLSIHEDTGKPYQIIMDVEIADGPEWLVEWCINHAGSPARETTEQGDAPIAKGGRNNFLTSELGKARQNLKMEYEELLGFGRSLNERRCSPPLPAGEVETIAKSIAGYPIAEANPVNIGGHPAGTRSHIGSQAAPQEVEIPKINKIAYPKFPDWIMHGTSIHEGFVKPWCEKNSRIPHFMFLPAAALMMNYLGLKVKIKDRNLIPNFMMVLIGQAGRAIKSSSVEDAIEYLHTAGAISHAISGPESAAGKSLVWTIGSPEGLGLEMFAKNCRNAVLFYDELSGLVSKADIEASSLRSALLSIAESGKFQNTTKSKRTNFSFEPRSYCASLIACTTTESFEDLWSRLAGKSSGLDDRFMFLYQPETLPKLTPKIDVNTVAGAMVTRARMLSAIQQKEYELDNYIPLEETIGELGIRTESRAEKWALYFAIDLGRDTIDDECVERGLAIARYERAVKRFLGNPEAETKIAAAQIKLRRMLEQRFNGRADLRELQRAMNWTRYGTEGWWRIYDGLKRAAIIAELGTGAPGDPKQVVVRVPLDD